MSEPSHPLCGKPSHFLCRQVRCRRCYFAWTHLHLLRYQTRFESNRLGKRPFQPASHILERTHNPYEQADERQCGNMRTLRKVARARPTRERKTVQKGYEFEVEAKVIAHDIPRKSAKRPSKSTSPPCYVPDQSDSDYGGYSEASGDTDPLQAAAFASGK